MSDSEGEAASSSGDHLVEVTLDERTIASNNPTIEEERASAIRDLLAENQFCLLPEATGGAAPAGGPYRLHLTVSERRLTLLVSDTGGAEVTRLQLSLAPFRRLIRDYFFICEQYYNAVRTQGPDRTEAIDMGRRAVHNEGAATLQDRLANKVSMDSDTARRLFTLVCVLHLKG